MSAPPAQCLTHKYYWENLPFSVSWLCVLVSHGCCYKQPQTWWLKTTQLITLVLCWPGAPYRSHWAKIKVSAGSIHFGGSRGERIHFLPFFLPSGRHSCSLTRNPFFHLPNHPHTSVRPCFGSHVPSDSPPVFKDPFDYIGLPGQSRLLSLL